MSGALSQLQAALVRRSVHPSTISPAAAELCAIFDHEVRLWQHDRNAYGEEIKRVKARLDTLEAKGLDE